MAILLIKKYSYNDNNSDGRCYTKIMMKMIQKRIIMTTQLLLMNEKSYKAHKLDNAGTQMLKK